jgi:hypothetical protein
MGWVGCFAVFVVSHLVGDYLLQTDWQARNKRGGLTGPGASRRALCSHIATYTLAFVPALVWLSSSVGAGVIWVAVLVAVPHLVQDDGRAIGIYMARVKRLEPGTVPAVDRAVDQTFHVLALFGLALLAGS